MKQHLLTNWGIMQTRAQIETLERVLQEVEKGVAAPELKRFLEQQIHTLKVALSGKADTK